MPISSPKCCVRRHRRVRPHNRALKTVPAELWLARAAGGRGEGRCPGARRHERSEGGVPAPRVKALRKTKRHCVRQSPYPKKHVRPTGPEILADRPRGLVCCVVFEDVVAMHASQRDAFHSCKESPKKKEEIQIKMLRSQTKTNKSQKRERRP